MKTDRVVSPALVALVVLSSLVIPATGASSATTLSLDLRCVGSGLRSAPGEPNDHDVLERKTDNDLSPDCIDPVSDSTNAFIAVVTDRQGETRSGVKVAFSFGYRINEDAATTNTSTDDATLSTADGPTIGTNPGTLKTYCVTGAKGRCKAILDNPVPAARDLIVIEAQIWRSMATRATDTATEQWENAAINGKGVLRLAPATASRQVGAQMTLTAKVMNQFGQPVQGANVDFRITAGPNNGLSQPGMTDAVTNADGVALFTYSSNVAGADNIQACSETGGTENDTCGFGEPFDSSQVTWSTG